MEFADFVKSILNYEGKKVILPFLMCIILISTAFLGSHLRSENVDREFVENSKKGVENLNMLLTEQRFFNDSIEKSTRERSQEISKRLQNNEKRIMNQPGLKLEKYLLGFVYESNLYPLLPSSLPAQESNSIIFSKQEGYFLTETYPETMAEIAYFQHKTGEINNEINSSRENWTLQKYRDRVEKIKRVDYPDSKIIDYLEEERAKSFSELFSDTGIDSSVSLNPVIEGEIKEIKVYHYIPAAISTFILYYFLSGIIIKLFRFLRSEIQILNK